MHKKPLIALILFLIFFLLITAYVIGETQHSNKSMEKPVRVFQPYEQGNLTSNAIQKNVRLLDPFEQQEKITESVEKNKWLFQPISEQQGKTTDGLGKKTWILEPMQQEPQKYSSIQFRQIISLGHILFTDFNRYSLWNEYYDLGVILRDNGTIVQEGDYTKAHDSMVIQCSNTILTGDQVNEIKDFVYNGGNLVMLGDYDDSSTLDYMNDISTEFGVEFNKIELIDESNNTGSSNNVIIRNHSRDLSITMFGYYSGCILFLDEDSIKNNDEWNNSNCTKDITSNDVSITVLAWGDEDSQADGLTGNIPVLARSYYGQGTATFLGESSLFDNDKIWNLDNGLLAIEIFKNPLKPSDTIPPKIIDVEANPSSQKVGKWVNITCNVTDNIEVNTVKVNITLSSSFVNETMTNIAGTNKYYYNVTYSTPGTYNYFIWANDISENENVSEANNFTILSPPHPDFIWLPPNPIINQTIIFNASLSSDPDGYITNYTWDFGDETNGTGVIAEHIYSSSGNYTVTLTVIDDDVLTNSTSKIISIIPAYGSISGTITCSCNGTAIRNATINLLQNGSLINSTTTDSNGNYTFDDLEPGEYNITVWKPYFWKNSTSLIVKAGEENIVDLTLLLIGDLDNNGNVADAVDVTMMIQASVGDIPDIGVPIEYYDVDRNGQPGDAVDVTMMIQASVGDIPDSWGTDP